MDEKARNYLLLLGAAAVLGVPVAFAAVLFQTAIHDVMHFVWEWVPHELGWEEPAGWYVVLVPALAGVLVATALHLPGHGGHSPLEGLGLAGVRMLHLVSILPASLATIALGLVLGPEAPLIALGLGLGGAAATMLRTGTPGSRVLAVAGAYAAIAVLFGSPLVAALMLFELAAASGAIAAQQLGRALLPGFVAAGTAYLTFTGVGDWPGLHQASLVRPTLPAYPTVRPADVAWCLPVAVVVAVMVVGLRHLAHRMSLRSAIRPGTALVAAGLLVGAVAVAFRALADRPVDLVLFSGQESLPAIVAEGSAWVLVALVAAKGFAYCLSLGAGFRGGPVFPALALGVVVGTLAADVLPGFDLAPAVATGLAAGTAAIMRAPFSAALLAFVLLGTASAEVAPIAIIAAAVGWLVATAAPTAGDRAVAVAETA